MQRNFFGSNYDYTIRVHLIGKKGAGKSNLLQRLCYDVFPEVHTEPCSLPRSVVKKFNGISIKMNLWDIPPDNSIFDVRYYYKTSAVLIVHDRTEDLLGNRNDFIAMITEHQKNYAPHAKYVLVGSKSDAEKPLWSANDADIHELAMSLGITGFINVSAKTGSCIDHLPINIISNIMSSSYRLDTDKTGTACVVQ